ncbi:lipase [Dacryopinax primogenitus]|uniref:Lipase n=1 Tax=Dacryopinax primogenitus (strain DJM 731) TaxID=1858805 RepID=M5FSS7_DACPD|nr:lipase [Dacryopinax primogenitus]EJT98309.1 lipase [Dacryopinax primogenitus]
MGFIRLALFGSIALSFVLAVPLLPRENTAAVTPLTTAQISSITPFAHMASASYCSSASNMSWSCGAQCEALPGMVPLAAGGNNDAVPDWYVAYYPSAGAAVVAHQGTNTASLDSWIDDLSFMLVDIDQTYFPGTSGLEVHEGFQSTFESTAASVLSGVQTAISSHGATQVYVVGHSLGAAIALFDALYLHEKVNVTITVRLFGLPRVGSQAFANYVDSNLGGLYHVTNDNDIVPRLPSTDFGFERPSGEVFITSSGGSTYDFCPGQENYNCAIGISFLDDSFSPHDGLYAGVMMGC